MKEALFGMTEEQIAAWVEKKGLPKYTSRQITGWLYKRHADTPEEMTNLSLKTRELLAGDFTMGLAEPAEVFVSSDGTRKYLFPTEPGKYVEAAYIPEKERATLCLSTQVGCRMGCLFCMTGKQGFQGNLTPGQILNQFRSLPERDRITNIVYMGMGEPLDNPNHVLTSIRIFTSDRGYAMSPRRITVSTIGLLPQLERFLDESEVHLAISLHSPFEEERKKLMPVENASSIKSVIEMLKGFDTGRQRRISFEYIMLRGLNDTPRHVKELIRMLGGMRCRMNLIRYHQIPGVSLVPSSDEIVEYFMSSLNSKGIRTTVRASRGEDISAACGMLSTGRKMKQED